MAQIQIRQLEENTSIANGDLFLHTDVSDGNEDKYVTAQNLSTYVLGQSNFVTLDTTQTITGSKTLTANTSITGNLGVNTSPSPAGSFSVEEGNNGFTVIIAAQNGARFEPTIAIVDRDTVPDNNTSIGSIQGRALNTAGQQLVYSSIRTHLVDSTLGNETSYIGLKAATGGPILGQSSEDTIRVTNQGLQIVQTGHGITFPGGDVLTYDEGEWTPVAVTANTSLTNVSATYVKVGDVVTLKASLRVISTSGAFLQLRGVPFLPSGNTGANDWHIGNWYKTGNNVGAGILRLGAQQDTIAFINPSAPQTADDLTVHADDLAGTQFFHTLSFNITYTT